jgi:serine protease Do
MRFVDKLRTQKLLSFTLILFTLAFGIVIGTLVNPGVMAEKDNNAAPGATPLVIPPPVLLSNEFAPVAKQVEPSVVHIQTETIPDRQPQARNNNGGGRRRQGQPQQIPDDGNGGMDNLFRFFGNPFGGQTPQAQRSSALGSGVMVDKAGYVLTNNHVVDGATRIRVKFMDSPKEYEATVVGVDQATDLAVIRVEPGHEFVPARIGNSDAVQVGDWAIAIGSPFGFQATVTAGIISAKQRDIPGDSTQFQHFLQTDAAINPGNSGGPLVNIRGEVIGINTAIASQSGHYEGIGFAMPINTAAKVYNDIIKSGKVTRGVIGVNYSADAKTNQALIKSAGVAEGVFVESVAAGGPADKAGLKDSDVIVAVNAKPIHDGTDLVNIVSNTAVGSSVTLSAVRDGKKNDYRVVIGDRSQVNPDQTGKEQSSGSGKSGGTSVSFGMSVQPLTDLRRQNLGIKESGGLEVIDVEPGSFAEDIGLAADDVLLTINNRALNTVQDLKEQQAKLKPGDAVAFKVLSAAPDAFGRRASWVSTYRAGELPANPR